MSQVTKRILCVDDDEDTCTMLSVFLGQAGFEVVSAQSSVQALELAHGEQFDLYLLDLWLKGEDEKVELFRRIRQFDGETPIVIYSADARQTTQNTLSEANVQAFLTKPKGLDNLVQTIKQLTSLN
ncbi:MAG TPA: response regulator [Pyrinomonadaceae bacterium]|nr:response regulator [Pyrinomonadaceae bacterium]